MIPASNVRFGRTRVKEPGDVISSLRSLYWSKVSLFTPGYTGNKFFQKHETHRTLSVAQINKQCSGLLCRIHSLRPYVGKTVRLVLNLINLPVGKSVCWRADSPNICVTVFPISFRACLRTSTLIRGGKLSSQLGLKTPATILEYLLFLEKTYLFSFVPKFDYSQKAQSVNPKKVYCIDTGMVKRLGLPATQKSNALLPKSPWLIVKASKTTLQAVSDNKAETSC